MVKITLGEHQGGLKEPVAALCARFIQIDAPLRGALLTLNSLAEDSSYGLYESLPDNISEVSADALRVAPVSALEVSGGGSSFYYENLSAATGHAALSAGLGETSGFETSAQYQDGDFELTGGMARAEGFSGKGLSPLEISRKMALIYNSSLLGRGMK